MKLLLVASLLITFLVANAVEPTTPPDSLQSDSLSFAADSTDSLTVVSGGSITENLLIPLAIIAATAAIFILLFTTRSR